MMPDDFGGFHPHPSTNPHGSHHPQPSITCPRCHMTSYNPTDIKERFCGNCDDWIADAPTVRIGVRLDEYLAAAERDGQRIPAMFTTESILESLRRQGVSAQECERLRPDVEKLAKGLSLKASGLPQLKSSLDDMSIGGLSVEEYQAVEGQYGPYGVDGPIRREDYES